MKVHNDGKSRRLLVFDVEGTLFKASVQLESTSLSSTIWQGLAQALGPEAVAAEIATHKKWHAGVYSSYLDWMRDTIRVHQAHGLTREVFDLVISNAEYNDGVVDFFKRLNRDRFEVVMISGGFRELSRRAQVDLGIYHSFSACEYFFGEAGTLVGFNLLPCDFRGKIDFIKLMLQEYGFNSTEWVFIGDGANDVPIATAAPISVAYCAHAELQGVATNLVKSFGQIDSIINF